MAEPEAPETPEENGTGEEPTRLNRGATRRGRTQANIYAAAGLIGGALLLFLWFLLGDEEERGRPRRPQTVTPAAAPTVPPPPEPAPAPPPPPPPPPPDPAPDPGPEIDPLAEERLRILLARVQRLQREQDQRRRSKMLAFSSTAAVTAAAAPAAAGPETPARDNAALTQTADNSIRVGNVGPVEETQAVQARVLRTTGYTITEGTTIAGVLETAINSTLPGMVRAINSADVYSHDGSQLLIPKGSRLVGRYQSDLRRGQVRIFVIWTRIIRADGVSILINSPGTDPLGRAGLAGDVDTHFFQIFGAAILLSIIDGGIELGVEMARRQGDNSDRTIIQSRPRGLSRAAELALQDSIRIPPTIHVDQGTRINILVARDLDFAAVEMARAQGN